MVNCGTQTLEQNTTYKINVKITVMDCLMTGYILRNAVSQIHHFGNPVECIHTK